MTDILQQAGQFLGGPVALVAGVGSSLLGQRSRRRRQQRAARAAIPPVFPTIPTYQPYRPQYTQPFETPLYRGLLPQFQQTLAGGLTLPEQYRQAVLSQAGRELGRQREIQEREAVERMNKLNLLGGGALGTQLGLIGQEYGRQMGSIEDQLMQAELAQRNRLTSQLQEIGAQQFDVERYINQLAAEQQKQAYESQVDQMIRQYQAQVARGRAKGRAIAAGGGGFGDLGQQLLSAYALSRL